MKTKYKELEIIRLLKDIERIAAFQKRRIGDKTEHRRKEILMIAIDIMARDIVLIMEAMK